MLQTQIIIRSFILRYVILNKWENKLDCFFEHPLYNLRRKNVLQSQTNIHSFTLRLSCTGEVRKKCDYILTYWIRFTANEK